MTIPADSAVAQYFSTIRSALGGLEIFLGDRNSPLYRNSVVGEVGLVDARPRTANVTCVGPVSAAVIPTPDLRRLLNQNRQWGFIVLSNIARVLASRLRQANARIDELTDLTTEPWTNALG